MFEGCTIKYVKSIRNPSENACIKITEPADGNGNVHEFIIPVDAVGNSQYDKVMKWVAEGNTIEEAD